MLSTVGSQPPTDQQHLLVMGNSKSKRIKIKSGLVPESSNSRSHSLASNTTGASEASSLRFQDFFGSNGSEPRPLSPTEINLIRYTWHLVQVDTSTICLNFLHQLQRRSFSTTISKSKSSSTPSLTVSKSSGTFKSRHRSLISTQSQCTQHALKLAVCLDSIIGSLIRYSKVKEDTVIKMLEDNGNQFKGFLGIDSFKDDTLPKEMALVFTESLRHTVVQHDEDLWTYEFQEAWCALFQILLYHLDGLDEDF